MNQPVYARNNPSYRICYKANGLWKLQEHDGSVKGTIKEDPWHDLSPAMSQDEALLVLNRYHKDKAKAA